MRTDPTEGESLNTLTDDEILQIGYKDCDYLTLAALTDGDLGDALNIKLMQNPGFDLARAAFTLQMASSFLCG